MPNSIYYVILVLTMAFSFLGTFSLVYLSDLQQPENKIPKRKRWALSIGVTALTLLMACVALPLPLYYLLLFLAYTLFYYTSGSSFISRQFNANAATVYFTCLHLLTLGIMSLLLHQEPNVLLSARDTRLLSLFAVASISVLLSLFFYKSQKLSRKVYLFSHAGEAFRLLVWFTWFAVFFTLFDSIPSMVRLPYNLMSWFLVGSNLLLLLLAAMFLKHVYTISQNIHVEEEHRALEEACRRQMQHAMELRKMADLDRLTGAYTRRYAMNHLQVLLNNGEPVSLVYIDIDHLKRVNDVYGHLEGDRFLKSFVSTLEAFLRHDELLARMGGDEFLLILQGVEKEKVTKDMQAVREEMRQKGQEGIPLSFSFGVAESSAGTGLAASRLLEEADRLMYLDKQARRKEGGTSQ